MNPLQIVILVLSILLIISVGLNIYFERLFWNWLGTIVAYVSQLFMLITGIILISAVGCQAKHRTYRSGLAMLYLSDIFTIGTIVVFKVWLAVSFVGGLFNWAALISVFLLTPLIVLVHLYLAKYPDHPDVVINITTSQQPLAPSYQQY